MKIIKNVVVSATRAAVSGLLLAQRIKDKVNKGLQGNDGKGVPREDNVAAFTDGDIRRATVTFYNGLVGSVSGSRNVARLHDSWRLESS